MGAIWAAVALPGAALTQIPAAPGKNVFDLRGTFTLVDGSNGYSTCTGSGGYSDISTGTPVTVYNAAGTVLAQGALGTGRPDTGGCVFPLSAPNVPDGEKFYLVEVPTAGGWWCNRRTPAAGRWH